MPIQIIQFTRGMTIDPPVYVDANFPISIRLRNHPNFAGATQLLLELSVQRVETYISTLTMDEVWWGLLREWYMVDNNQRLRADMIKQNPNILQRYASRFQQIVSSFSAMRNVKFLPHCFIDANTTVQMATYFMTNNGLSPRDSFHLALAVLSHSAGFITSDADFDSISLPNTSLKIYKY